MKQIYISSIAESRQHAQDSMIRMLEMIDTAEDPEKKDLGILLLSQMTPRLFTLRNIEDAMGTEDAVDGELVQLLVATLRATDSLSLSLNKICDANSMPL